MAPPVQPPAADKGVRRAMGGSGIHLRGCGPGRERPLPVAPLHRAQVSSAGCGGLRASPRSARWRDPHLFTPSQAGDSSMHPPPKKMQLNKIK